MDYALVFQGYYSDNNSIEIVVLNLPRSWLHAMETGTYSPYLYGDIYGFVVRISLFSDF